jgi:dienelactone hydrolase
MRLMRRLVLVIVIIAGVLAVPAVTAHVRSASLVVRAAGMHGWWADPLARFQTAPFTKTDTTIPARGGPMRARIYEPASRRARVVLLTGGVHADGIDEPRLVKLAGDLASGGTPVVTAEVSDLLQYRITPALTDAIEDATAWVAGQQVLAPDGRIGVFGISFAGGLSIVAAGRPRVRDRVAYVVSFGGHGNLGRVVRYLCTGRQPDGTYRKPHDYGVVVALVNGAERVVPPDQVQPLREGIVTFLQASHLDMVDKAAAKKVFDRARALEKTMPAPASTYLGYVNNRNVEALGALLLPLLAGFGDTPALSPELSPGVTAPVFLLHGADDNVVPAIESRLLAERLRGGRPVTLLVSPLITHAEVDQRSSAGDVWGLIRFWYGIGQAGAL